MAIKISIETIPHSEQRYETVGDYWITPDSINIRVSDMKNWRYEFLVALHELVELGICFHKGIAISDIDKFDKEFKGNGEPGDDHEAPYFMEHQIATCVEALVANRLNVNWEEYDQRVKELYNGK